MLLLLVPGRPGHRHRAVRPVAERRADPRPAGRGDRAAAGHDVPRRRGWSRSRSSTCGIDPARPATCANAVVEVLDGDGRRGLPADRAAAGGRRRRGGGGRHAGAHPRRRGRGRGRPTASSTTSATPRSSPWRIAFAVVVGLVARLRGLASLVGLAFAFFILLQFVLPGLLAEESPTLVSLVGSSAIMFVVLYLAHGFSARTTTALVGTLFGLTLVAVLGSVVGLRRPADRADQRGDDPRCTATTRRSTSPAWSSPASSSPGSACSTTSRSPRPRRSGSCTRSSPDIDLAGALQPRDGRRPRPHRLDRLHDRLRLRGRRAAAAAALRALPAAVWTSSSPAPRWPRRSSAPWSARSRWCSPCPVTTAAGAFFAKAAGHRGRGGHRAADDRPAGTVRPVSEAADA